MKRMIQTPDAPKAIGPYSQAVWAGDMLFISGQIALDPATGNMVGATAAEQTAQVFKNIGAILKAAGLDFTHVVKMTVLLTDMKEFAAVNEVYAKHFTGDFPARAAYQVVALPKGALVEIETIAYRG
ncbi:MAG TPA: RidA family protein [bacterium]|nr:RidA family protein [bacterium]